MPKHETQVTKPRNPETTKRKNSPSGFRGFGVSCSLFVSLLATLFGQTPPDIGWRIHRGVDNIRFSPLKQITRDNVSKLQVAWTYDSHDAFKGSEMQSNPIV